MLTPQQNLEAADRLAQVITEAAKGKTVTVADTIALANLRISLAQAIHMVQLSENINGTFENDPRKLT